MFANRPSIPFFCSILFLALSAQPVNASDNTAPVDRTTKHALDILYRSTKFIEARPAFIVSGEAGGELLLDNGLLVEHGFRFKATFNRPSQLKLVMNGRDGSHSEMYFDGQTITVVGMVQGQQIYDSTPQKGDVNQSLDYMIQETGGQRELRYILADQLTQTLGEVQSAVSLGKSTIDEIACDHLVVQHEGRDGQIWIARGEEPAPRRSVIIHTEVPRNPRFWVQFEEWEFAPELSESTFDFTPSDNAEKFQYFQN